MDVKKKRKVRKREDKESFSIYVSSRDKAILERIAEDKDMSVSALVRKAIDGIIKEYMASSVEIHREEMRKSKSD